MASPKSPPGSVRRAGRNISHPMTRRTTRGPLETIEDPLTAATGEAANVTSDGLSPDASKASNHNMPEVAHASIVRTLPPQLRFLQDPRLYHQIPKDGTPRAFLESSQQPPADTSLPELLNHGHFRRAAESALQQLLQASGDDASLVLQFLYCRLACLTLITRLDIAADEALPLLDFISSSTSGVSEVLPLIPWPLRILLVKLQSVAAQDGGRRAIMTLYTLAGEVRTNIREARLSGDDTAVQTWSNRLSDLGLRVSDTLVEIGELETANRHLDTLVDVDKDEVLSRKVLLHVRTGDIVAARECAQAVSDSHRRAVHEALLSIADTNMNNVVKSWQSLNGQNNANELAAQNEGVFLLYTGHIQDALHNLEQLVEKGPLFATLLFNLSTINELCSDKAQIRKQDLAVKLASRPAHSLTAAWERSTAELKL